MEAALTGDSSQKWKEIDTSFKAEKEGKGRGSDVYAGVGNFYCRSFRGSIAQEERPVLKNGVR